MPKPFTINKFLTLKFEGGETTLYVDNKPFRQCMSLMINVSPALAGGYDEINSIDEASDVNNLKLPFHVDNYNIKPEQEFFGHCSNLKVWTEHQYDTRLPHSSLAFPLLEELMNVGDPIARRRFKEEVAFGLVQAILLQCYFY